MVGLSIVLEAQKGTASSFSKKNPQVINKATMSTKPTQPASSTSSTLSPSFLDKCFLCRKKLLPTKDIFMYKGDKGFCSVECRCRQIHMDEIDQTAAFMRSSKRNTYKVNKTTNCSSYSSSSTSKTTRNPAF